MNVSRIKVAVRIRPFIQQEVKQGYKNSRISLNNQKKIIQVILDEQNRKIFQFDYSFNQRSSQQDVYNGCAIDNLIQKTIQGYHSTIFAYGQTGSGKTYCMQGIDEQNNIENEFSHKNRDGLSPRIIKSLFQKIKQHSVNKTFTIYVSYMQIYNEKIFDLLNPSSLNPKTLNSNIEGLRLRWNKNQQFTVQNLFIFECKNKQQLIQYFQYGLKNRINSSHKLNMNSSRSHTILSIKVQSFDHKNQNQVLTSRIDLVDLAGSQRAAFTGNEGRLAKQSIDINKSLFTLRQVISTLADWNKQKSKEIIHIPYRESKLTSILKQSIGGNSFCLMVACINPNDNFFDQNISTLTYATKATMITNKPTINDDPRNKLINQLKNQVRTLQSQLIKANKHIQIISTQSNTFKQQSTKLKNNEDDSQELIPVVRKKMNQKLKSNNQQISDKLIQSINMVRELLKSNKDLREQLEINKRNNQEKDISIYELEKQNQQIKKQIYLLMNKRSFSAKSYPKKKQNIHKEIIYNNRINPQHSARDHKSNNNHLDLNQCNYDDFQQLQVNQFYENEIAIDRLPTNFNKRPITTARQYRNDRNMDQQGYRNVFTAVTNKRRKIDNEIPIVTQKRLSIGIKNKKINQTGFY